MSFSVPPVARLSTAHICARDPPARRLYARDAIPVVERKERILARRMPARVVLRLTSSNLSLNVIAAALHASKVSVSDALRAAAERDVAWKEMERMSAGEVYARLSPDRVPIRGRYTRTRIGTRSTPSSLRLAPRSGSCTASTARMRRSGRGGHVLRPLLQAVQAVHGQREGCEQGRPQGGQERGGRLVLSDHAPRRPREYLGNGFTSNPVTVR
mgnify:CR=1 FL=1